MTGIHKFLVLEGVDGAGKTSLRKLAFQATRRCGRELLTIVPHSWRDLKAAEIIVQAKFHDVAVPVASITEANVHDKEALSERLLRPHLRRRPVLSDRFVTSDMVYHKVLWGAPLADTYRRLCNSRIRMPDVTLFVDTPPLLAFERARRRGTGGLNRWDRLDEQERIYELFQEVLFSGRYPSLGDVIRIDNSGQRSHAERQLIGVLSRVLEIPALGS